MKRIQIVLIAVILISVSGFTVSTYNSRDTFFDSSSNDIVIDRTAEKKSNEKMKKKTYIAYI